MPNVVHIRAKLNSPSHFGRGLGGGDEYKRPHPSPPLEGDGTNF